VGAGNIFEGVRIIRRLWRPFLTAEDKRLVSAAIADAEKATTGEICVHVVSSAGPGELLEQARAVFAKLGLHKTKRRNAVLIFIADLDRKAAIWGDVGIHEKAGQVLWDRAEGEMLSLFKQGKHGEGVAAAVRAVGRQLAVHFPPEGDNPNELPDDVSQS
jgi:uncharacterized membrane protein